MTIKDIAENLGISKTSISFVLNGKAREKNISVALETKVLAYMEQVGYRPNQFAQGLRNGKTKIIGMLVEDISDSFFSSVARLMEEKAYNSGYKIIYASTENNAEKAKELIQLYRARLVDGYIIAPPPGIEKDINDLIDDDLPVVLFDRSIAGVEANSVTVNNYASSYDAVLHFIENGFKNIAMITLNSDQMQMKEREDGYCDALKRIKASPIIEKIDYLSESDDSIKQIEDFIIRNKEVDALFLSTNYIAEQGLEAIQNLKLKIPDDLGVIVFDDQNFYRLFQPPITAVSQPIKNIADTVIELMLNLLGDESEYMEVNNVILPTEFIIRESAIKKR
ncbi:MAG TPA: LacI family DNA-binding transcriptional regulator [Pelobium sp.]|nr:LacI family DNA-binding transcriptional regulator [Pelobium sp.]